MPSSLEASLAISVTTSFQAYLLHPLWTLALLPLTVPSQSTPQIVFSAAVLIVLPPQLGHTADWWPWIRICSSFPNLFCNLSSYLTALLMTVLPVIGSSLNFLSTRPISFPRRLHLPIFLHNKICRYHRYPHLPCGQGFGHKPSHLLKAYSQPRASLTVMKRHTTLCSRIYYRIIAKPSVPWCLISPLKLEGEKRSFLKFK